MPGHTFLYSPPVVAVRNLIESGELGDLYFVSTSRVNLGLHQKDVSVIWDLAPHDFSILRYWLGRDAHRRPRAQPRLHHPVASPTSPSSTSSSRAERSPTSSCPGSRPSKLRRTTIVGSRKMVVYDDTSTEPVRRLRLRRRAQGPRDVRRIPPHLPNRRHRLTPDRRRRAALGRAAGLLRSRDARNHPPLVSRARTPGRTDDRGSRPIARSPGGANVAVEALDPLSLAQPRPAQNALTG